MPAVSIPRDGSNVSGFPNPHGAGCGRDYGLKERPREIEKLALRLVLCNFGLEIGS